MSTTAPPTPPTGPHPVHAEPRSELERFPVLDEVPELGAALEAAKLIDRTTAQLVAALMRLQEHGIAERLTGVALEQWLAIVGRRTAADRRMLLTACDTLRRLPMLRDAFVRDGTVSWAQTRAVVLRVCRLPRHLDARIDAELAGAITHGIDSDPDALIHRVGWICHELQPEDQARDQRDADGGEFLALQPRLDGSGGRVFGDFGPLGFATLDAALTDPTPPPTRTRDDFGEQPDPSRSRDARLSAGRRRAQRLLDLCEAPGTASSPPGGGDAGPAAARRPQLLVRVDLSTLLDRDRTPASLLTTLTGGRMWASAETIRALVDERGADLRTVLFDDSGAVVGVGRRQRLAPGWLRDTVLALHDSCAAPGCRVAARMCDVDHAAPWRPARPEEPAGRTDVDQLAPVCRTDNRTKERAGWRVSQESDGSRTWWHERTGLRTTTRAATWRPPPVRDEGPAPAVAPAPTPAPAQAATAAPTAAPIRRAAPHGGPAPP